MDPTEQPIDAAALRARIEASRLRVAEAQARAERARATLDEQTTSATSPDRSVTVTVGTAGTLLDLSLTPAAAKLSMPDLTRTILGTYRQATVEAVAATEAVLRDVVGDDAPVLDLVRASVQTQEES